MPNPSSLDLRRKTRLIVLAVFVALAVAVTATMTLLGPEPTEGDAAFAALVAAGQAALPAVQSFTSQGRDHLQPGQDFTYSEEFPTSGPHAPVWTKPGLYGEPQPMTELVHALEHGNIVIHYDLPGDQALATLQIWTDFYTGQWDGLVAVPKSGLGGKTVLLAWNRRLDLDPFDEAAAAAFVDAYRGRGPEHPVR